MKIGKPQRELDEPAPLPKIEPQPESPRYVVTQPGVGYVFRAAPCGRPRQRPEA